MFPLRDRLKIPRHKIVFAVLILRLCKNNSKKTGFFRPTFPTFIATSLHVLPCALNSRREKQNMTIKLNYFTIHVYFNVVKCVVGAKHWCLNNAVLTLDYYLVSEGEIIHVF